MNDSQRLDVKIRFQPYPHHQLGQVLLYLDRRGYDRTKEAEKLFISRFLPFALHEQEDLSGNDRQAAIQTAQDCMIQMSGAAQAIQAMYQLPTPVSPPTPQAEALSQAYECIAYLSSVIHTMQAVYRLPLPMHTGRPIPPGSSLSPGLRAALNGQGLRSVDADGLDEDLDDEELESEQKRETQPDQDQNEFLKMFGV
jgi:hypothetical protein